MDRSAFFILQDGLYQFSIIMVFFVLPVELKVHFFHSYLDLLVLLSFTNDMCWEMMSKIEI